MDEFQDLSLAQYEVVTELAARHRQLLRRGRRRAVDLLLDRRRPRDPGAASGPTSASPTPIILDLNRRCSRQIFEAARRLVTHNPGLFEKQLEADPRVGALRRRRTPSPTNPAEADWLVADLLRDRAGRRARWGDYGVLYRSHRIGQRLETRLIECRAFPASWRGARRCWTTS